MGGGSNRPGVPVRARVDHARPGEAARLPKVQGAELGPAEVVRAIRRKGLGPAMPPRPSFALRIDRAREHLDTFEREAERWIKKEPYGIVDEPDPEPRPEPVPDICARRRLRIVRVSDVPQELSLP